MDKGRASGFVGCIVEAMANAYKHANGGVVSLHRDSDRFVAVIADSGPGIEALALPDVALRKGYTTAISLGMGYEVMTSIADKVYLATRPGETVVAVEMSISPEKTDAEKGKMLVRS
jgi:anti-sigma regulatory factor (Ser/Thr protein kinase)